MSLDGFTFRMYSSPEDRPGEWNGYHNWQAMQTRLGPDQESRYNHSPMGNYTQGPTNKPSYNPDTSPLSYSEYDICKVCRSIRHQTYDHPKCKICGKGSYEGHVPGNCPKKNQQVCRRCAGYGHDENQCPSFR